MTGHASGVVIRGVCHKFLVRIVTGRTADAFVLMVIAFAFEDAVGLEPDVFNAPNSQHLHLNPGTMARAAELRKPFRIELPGVEDLSVRRFWRRFASVPCLAARLHRQDVFFTGAVTPFTCDSRSHFVQSKLSLTDRGGRVTTETVIDDLRIQHAP